MFTKNWNRLQFLNRKPLKFIRSKKIKPEIRPQKFPTTTVKFGTILLKPYPRILFLKSLGQLPSFTKWNLSWHFLYSYLGFYAHSISYTLKWEKILQHSFDNRPSVRPVQPVPSNMKEIASKMKDTKMYEILIIHFNLMKKISFKN